ncbi:MAG: chorismate mutase, partial [Firmicutes bacterium]|nr:chorismate mutase [Bacillota bacterium]
GVIKSASQYDVLDSNREEQILLKASKYSRLPQIKAIYQTIFDESKKLQRK